MKARTAFSIANYGAMAISWVVILATPYDIAAVIAQATFTLGLILGTAFIVELP